MTTHYVNYATGNDSNSGLSPSLPKKTITGVGIAGNGDDIRIAASPAAVLRDSGATWTSGSALVTLSSPLTQNIDTCNVTWTAETNATAASSSTCKEGTFSQYLTTNSSFTTGGIAKHTLTSVNYTSSTIINLWIQVGADTPANTLAIRLLDGGGSPLATANIPALKANRWTPIAVTGLSLPNAPVSVELYANSTFASSSVYLDNIFASAGITLQSLIFQAPATPTLPSWAIKSINGTSLYVDQDPQSLVGQGRGIFGGTGVFDLWSRETIKTTPVSGNTSVQTLDATFPPNITGGWNSGFTSVTGQTWYDGLNGLGLGLDMSPSPFSSGQISNLGFVRYNQGLQDTPFGGGNNTYTSIMVGHNTTDGAMITSSLNSMEILAYSNAEDGMHVSVGTNNQLVSGSFFVSNGACGVSTANGGNVVNVAGAFGNNLSGNICINPTLVVAQEEDLSMIDLTGFPFTIINSEALAMTDSPAGVGIHLPVEEDIATADADSPFSIVPDLELLPLLDSLGLNAAVVFEGLAMADALAAFPTVSETEGLSIQDSNEQGTIVQDFETVPMADSDTTGLTVPWEDDLDMLEAGFASEVVTDTENLAMGDFVSLSQNYTFSCGVKVQIPLALSANYSTNINVAAATFVASNSSANAANPLAPTVIIDGSSVITNGATTPSGDVSNVNVLVNFLAGGLPTCDIFNFNVDLNFGGGTWSITTQTPWTALGDTVVVFGLKGVCTSYEIIQSNHAVGYVASGIFGSLNMNKQILFVTQDPTMAHIAGLVPTQALQQPPSNLWTSAASAAQSIAAVAGINLHWYAQDTPLIDFLPQSGQTVGQVLSSLVSMVQGILCWDGNINYVVIKPTQGYGSWADFLSCQLLGPAGVYTKSILDTTNSVLLFPVNSVNSISVDPINLFGYTPPVVVYNLQSFRSAINLGDAQSTLDVPGDFQQAYVRNVVTTTEGVTGPFLTVPSPAFPAGVWQEATMSIIVDPSSGKRQFVVTPDMFPVGATSFQLDIGYTRNVAALNTAYTQQQQEAAARQQLLTQAQLESIVYFRTNESSINSVFFGSVPLPGQLYSYSLSNIHFQGIIENVNISYPGYLTMTIGTYQKLNFLSPRASLDFFNAGAGYLGP